MKKFEECEWESGRASAQKACGDVRIRINTIKNMNPCKDPFEQSDQTQYANLVDHVHALVEQLLRESDASNRQIRGAIKDLARKERWSDNHKLMLSELDIHIEIVRSKLGIEERSPEKYFRAFRDWRGWSVLGWLVWPAIIILGLTAGGRLFFVLEQCKKEKAREIEEYVVANADQLLDHFIIHAKFDTVETLSVEAFGKNNKMLNHWWECSELLNSKPRKVIVTARIHWNGPIVTDGSTDVKYRFESPEKPNLITSEEIMRSDLNPGGWYRTEVGGVWIGAQGAAKIQWLNGLSEFQATWIKSGNVLIVRSHIQGNDVQMRYVLNPDNTLTDEDTRAIYKPE